MQRYEYKVIPAPRRGEKTREARTTEDRFALALTNLLNRMGRDGWEYQRSDALTCEERAGLTGTRSTEQSVLIFRRPLAEAARPIAVLDSATAPGAGNPPAAPRLGPATEAPLGPAPAVTLD